MLFSMLVKNVRCELNLVTRKLFAYAFLHGSFLFGIANFDQDVGAFTGRTQRVLQSSHRHFFVRAPASGE